MVYIHQLPYGLIFAIAAVAQDTSSSSSGSGSDSGSASGTGTDSIITLTGSTATAIVPTGPYLSYSSTKTLTTSSSAISTSALISTVTSGSTTRTTTLGSTTIFGYSTQSIGSNSTTSTSTSSQLFLQGSNARSTASIINGTSNATSSAIVPVATNSQACNNYRELCSMNYGNITEVSAHNSPFIKTGNAAANQALSVTTQLNDGIRMLQAQAHLVDGIPHFCHTSCDLLDAGPITTYLGEVYDWVNSHPYDVVTILIGNGNYSPPVAYAPYIESTGLLRYAYEPPKIPMGINDWPTLASMILTGKRVIFFMDYGANQTAYPWLMDEFSQMWETPFDPTNQSFPCTIQRPPPLLPSDAIDRLYMINHNLNYDISILGQSLLVPNIPLLNVTNNSTGFGSLGVTAEQCLEEWAYAPKFLNVDYYNVGNGSVFEVAAKMNNVTYTRTCCGLATSGAGILAVIGRSAIVVAFAVVSLSWMML